MKRMHGSKLFTVIPMIIMLLSVIRTYAIVPSPEISAGKQKIQNGTMVAFNIGTGYTRLLWYWNNSSVEWRYNNVQTTYQIQTSSNSTNGSDGTWSTVITVAGNSRATRVHTFDFTGKTWVRMYNAGGLTVPNFVEVHDVSRGCEDTWFYIGDSMTWFTFAKRNQPDYQADIHALFPAYSPVMVDGGIAGDRSGNGAQNIDDYLAEFPDIKFWAIMYGTNDSWNNHCCLSPVYNTSGLSDNMQMVVNKIIAAGRVPVIAKIPFAPGTEHLTIPLFNTAIDTLARRNELMNGPDAYTYFKAHPEELDNTQVHFDDTGTVSMNRLWANAMATVPGLYTNSSIDISGFTSTPSAIVGGAGTALAFSAQLFPGSGDAIAGASLDLTSLGGGAATAMVRGNGNSYSCSFTPGASVSAGPKNVMLRVTDNRGGRDSALTTVRIGSPAATPTITNIYTDGQNYAGLVFDNVTEASAGAYEGTKCLVKSYTNQKGFFSLFAANGSGVIDMSGQDSLRIAYKGQTSAWALIGVDLITQGQTDTVFNDSSFMGQWLGFTNNTWRQTSIPLSLYSGQGKNLSRIARIRINIIDFLGNGTVSVDDIKLVKSTPTAVEPPRQMSGCSLTLDNGMTMSVTGRTVVFTTGEAITLKIYDLKGKTAGTVQLHKTGSALWQAPSAGIFFAQSGRSLKMERIIIR